VQKYQVVTFTETTSPLDQFDIIDLISLDAPIFGNIHISLTNIGLYLTIGAFLTLSLNIFATNNNKIISNK
jgi:F-type H+-transporting ATPase subunit a